MGLLYNMFMTITDLINYYLSEPRLYMYVGSYEYSCTKEAWPTLNDTGTKQEGTSRYSCT
jgi:hypothetical protein